MPRVTSHKARELHVEDIPMDKPIITLDVDGVLNAFEYVRERYPWPFQVTDVPETYRINHSRKVVLPAEMCHQMGYWPGKSFTITWSDDLMADIAAVAEAGKANIVWLTSWNEFADFLGWKCFWRGNPSPAIGYVDCTLGRTRSSYVGKIHALWEMCSAMKAACHDGEEAPGIVAFDDDAPWDYRSWNKEDEPFPSFFRGVATNPRYGITKTQWRTVLDILGAN